MRVRAYSTVDCRLCHVAISIFTFFYLGDVVIVDLSKLELGATLVEGCWERRSVEKKKKAAVVVKGALSDGSSQPAPDSDSAKFSAGQSPLALALALLAINKRSTNRSFSFCLRSIDHGA